MPSLKIELIVDDKGNITIAKAEKGLEALNAEATKLGASFSGALGKMQTTLEGMNVSLRKTEAHTAQTSKSIAGLTRSILRLYAAHYVITSGIQAVSGAMLKGIEIIDQYSNAITTMAALVTSKMKFNPGETLAEGYARARTYADGLVKTLESIDKHSSMSQRELIAMAETMTRAGVTLNYTNAEAVKGFTELSNALSAVIGNVPDRMRQINQEIKALLTGQVRPSDALAQTVASMTPEFEKQLEIHKKAGDVWQWLGNLVKGFAAAQSDIDRSWQATKSTLETVATQILRDGFGNAYKEIIVKTKELSKWALDHKKEIADIINSGWNVLKTTVSGIAAPFQAAAWAVSNLRKEIVTLSATLTGIYLSGVIATALETGKLIKLFRELIQVIEILSSRALLTLASRFGLVGIAVGAAAYGVMTMIERQKELDKIVQGNDLDAINKKIDEYTKKLKSIPTSADLYAQAQNRGKSPYQEELDRLIAARDRLLAEQKRTADEMEKARKAANVQLNQNPNDEATKKAADEAKRLDDIYKKLKNTLKDSIAIQRFEVTEMESVGVQIEKNRIEYLAYVRDLDEKLSPARRIHLASLKAEETELKNLNALLEDHAKYVKQWADEEWKGIEDREKDAEAAQRQIDAFESLYLSLDPVIGASKRYSRALEDIKNAQTRLNAGQGGTITQEQINRATALLEAQKNVYNTGYVADYYSQIAGMEDEALQKRLAAIEEERKMNDLLFDERTAQILASQKMAEAYAETIVKKNKPVMDAFGGMAELLEGIGSLYEEGSSQAKTFADAANALIIAQKALAVVNAVAAVAASASAPWPVQWVNMAAMLAAMGSLLGSIGASINGGGGHGESAEAYKPTTVLGGSSGEASKSIQNALELLNDVNGESYGELVGIHRNMRELNANITGLVRNLLQGKGASLTTGGGSSSHSHSVMDYVYSWGLGDVRDMLGSIPYIGGVFKTIAKTASDIVDWVFDLVGFSGLNSSRSTVTQQGVQLGATTIGELLDGAIVDSWYYAIVSWKKKSWGKVRRGVRTYLDAMDEDTSRMFNLVYQNLAQGLVGIATALGQDASKVLQYGLPQQRINLKGLKPDEYEKKISEWMNTLADTAVSDLFGGFLNQFQKLGEGLYETAIRVVMDKAVVLDALQAIGQAWRGSTEELVYFSESLIDMAGDLDDLRDMFSTYTEAFLTEEQRVMHARQSMIGILAMEGMTLPATREAYAGLVASLDLMTDSGQSAFYTLLRLSDAADGYYDYLEKRAENVVDTLKGYVDRLQSAKDKLLGTTEAKAGFSSALDELRGVLADVRQGKFAGLENIGRALDTVSSISKDQYRSSLAYAHDYWSAMGTISELQELTSDQLSEQQQLLNLLQTNHDEDIDVAMASLNALLSIQAAVTGSTPHVASFGHFASGGYNPGGWSIVGENGPELRYSGPETIVSNDKSKALLDLSTLEATIQGLRTDIQTGNFAMTTSLKRVEKALVNVTDGAVDANNRPALRTAV